MTDKTAQRSVRVGGGTAGSAYLSCATCHVDFLSTGGDWGDDAGDVPAMPVPELVALILAHTCNSAALR